MALNDVAKYKHRVVSLRQLSFFVFFIQFNFLKQMLPTGRGEWLTERVRTLFRLIIIIIMKNEYHINIIVDRLQGCRTN